MKKYRLLLNGRNFLMRVDGRLERSGFYTTRIVTASSPEEAEKLAIDLIRNDSSLRASVLNEPSNPPIIYVDEYAELEGEESADGPNAGYTFYPEKEEADQ
jgi:hypothetical protein